MKVAPVQQALQTAGLHDPNSPSQETKNLFNLVRKARVKDICPEDKTSDINVDKQPNFKQLNDRLLGLTL